MSNNWLQHNPGAMGGYVGLEDALYAQAGVVRLQMARLLDQEPPHVVFGDPAYERDNLDTVRATNELAVAVSGVFTNTNERRAVYETMLWARFMGKSLLDITVDVLPEDIITPLQSGTVHYLEKLTHRFYSPRQNLAALKVMMLHKIDREGRYLSSANIVSGIVFSRIEDEAERRAAERLAGDFTATLTDDQALDKIVESWKGPGSIET